MSNELDIIEALYSAAADPDRFDELISTWHGKLERRSKEGLGIYPGSLDRLARHVDGVDRILEQIQESGEEIPPLFREWINNTPHPTLLVDRHLTIRARSVAAQKYWLGKDSRSLRDVFTNDNTYYSVKASAEKLFSTISEHRQLSPILIEPLERHKQRPTHLSVSLRSIRSGLKLVVIQSSKIIWSKSFDQISTDTFELTEAEIEVSKLLVDGATPTEISLQRGTSMATVRGQLKSIYAKTSTRNQAELVGMIAGLATLNLDTKPPSFYPSTETPFTISWPLSHHYRMHRLSDGRSLAYAEFGDPEGYPCVYFHNELFGDVWPEGTARLFEKFGLKLILPARPFYGASAPYPNGVLAQTQFANDLFELIKHLKLDKVVLVSFSGGGIFSLAFATLYPNSCLAQLAIAPAFPIVTSDDEENMPISYRFMNSLVSRHPSVFETFLRLGYKYYKRKGAIGFLRFVFKGVNSDLYIIDNKQHHQALTRGIEFCTQNQHRACFHDYRNLPRDMFEKLSGSSLKIVAIVGDSDKNSRIERTDKMIQAGLDIRKVVAAGGGTLLHYTHGRLIVDELVKLWESVENTD